MARVKTRWFRRTGEQRIILCGGGAKSGPITPYRPLREALKTVEEAGETHALTQQLAPEVLAGWKAWAAEHAKAFQQASSAVEGRNGYLSQMHHNQRGLPKHRYKVWTVLHNFDCRAADGTTPASRFFRREFPDLLETVLSRIVDVPRPRQRPQALVISD